MSRRIAAPILALLVVLGFAVGAQSDPGTGVQVPTLAEHNAVEQRVTDLEEQAADHEARLTAVEDWIATAPTPTPTPDPDPDPTEEPTPDPDPDPEPGVFPTRDSVGPAVDPTEPYAGDCYFDAGQSGEVIDGKVLDCDAAGGVKFAQDATGIVFRNSVIRGQMMTLGNTPGDPGADETRAPVFTVEDSKIVQSTTADWQDRALCCAHYVVKRSLIQGTHSGLAAHNNVELVGNYITTDGTDSHSSGVRVLKNTVLRGNTIQCKPVTAGHDGGCSAAGVFYSERLDGTSAAAHDLTIEGNYFKRGVTPVDPDTGQGGEPGGPWYATRFIDCANRTDCTGITFAGNQFGIDADGWGTDGGEFPAAYGGNVWADNVWADGGVALSGQVR